jgi:hypothetical protein
MDAVDKVIFEYAAAFMMASRKGHKENVTVRDVQEFVAHLDADGREELYQIAVELDFIDGAVWLGPMRLTPASETCH